MSNLSSRDETVTDIRIRAAVTFILIQAIIAWCDTYSSAVTNLMTQLKWHTLLDGTILISTFVMVTTFSRLASIASLLTWAVDGITLFLTFQAVTRCFDIYQSKACFSTIPQDIITASLLGLVILLDFMQYNQLVSLIDQIKLKTQPAVQHHILQRRARLLHLWSFPFAVGVLVAEIIFAVDTSTVDALATPIYLHIILDPILAYTATENKPALLHVLGAILSLTLLIADFMNLIDMKKPFTTYKAYKEWCLYTLIIFDIIVLGVRVFVASYKPEVIVMVAAQTNKAKWSVQKILNPTKKTKKNT